MTDMHVAEFNVARLRYPLDDPRVADFTGNLDRVNAVAERSLGFVWRLKDEGGNATAFSRDADQMTIPNLSVWTDVASLERFVFQTVHKRFYARRAEWFDAMEAMHFVLWPVAPGHEPSLEEAWARLDDLNTNGPSERAFGWAQAGDATLWRTARCAGAAA